MNKHLLPPPVTTADTSPKPFFGKRPFLTALAGVVGSFALGSRPADAKAAEPNTLHQEQIRRSEEVNQYLFLQAELLKAKGAGNPKSLAEIQTSLNASPQEQYFNLLDQTIVNGISYESGGPVNVYADSKEQVTIVYQSELSGNDYLQAGRTDPNANFFELVARNLYKKSISWSGNEDWRKKDDPNRNNGTNKWALVERIRNQNGKDVKSYDVVLAPDPYASALSFSITHEQVLETLTHPAYDLRKKVINADEVSYTAKFINVKDIPPTPEMIQTRDLLESALRKLKPDRQFKVDIYYERPGRKYNHHGGVDAHPGERDTRQPYQFVTLEEEGLSVYKPNPESASALLEEALNRARQFTYINGGDDAAMDMDLLISALESVHTPREYPDIFVLDDVQRQSYLDWEKNLSATYFTEVKAFLDTAKKKRQDKQLSIPPDPSQRLGIGIWRPDEIDQANLFIQKRRADGLSAQSPFDSQAIVINLKP